MFFFVSRKRVSMASRPQRTPQPDDDKYDVSGAPAGAASTATASATATRLYRPFNCSRALCCCRSSLARSAQTARGGRTGAFGRAMFRRRNSENSKQPNKRPPTRRKTTSRALTRCVRVWPGSHACLAARTATRVRLQRSSTALLHAYAVVQEANAANSHSSKSKNQVRCDCTACACRLHQCRQHCGNVLWLLPSSSIPLAIPPNPLACQCDPRYDCVLGAYRCAHTLRTEAQCESPSAQGGKRAR